MLMLAKNPVVLLMSSIVLYYRRTPGLLGKILHLVIQEKDTSVHLSIVSVLMLAVIFLNISLFTFSA